MAGIGHIEGDDAEAGEGGEFARLADAVLIQVAPDLELGESGVQEPWVRKSVATFMEVIMAA